MSLEIYTEIKTLDEAKQIIAQQDMIIGEQLRRIQFYQDTIFNYNQAKDKRIIEAGYDRDTSFDIVWNETLKKANSK